MATIASWKPFDFLPQDPPPEINIDAAGNQYAAFNAGTDELVILELEVPDFMDVVGDVEVLIRWRAETATTGSVVWGVEFEAITDADAINTRTTSSFAAIQTVTTAAPGSLGNTVTSTITLTIAQADSLAVDDKVRIRLRRDANNGSDDMLNDAECLGVRLKDAA